MQESVTRKHLKRHGKHRIKPLIFTILFFLIIFFITAILIISKRSNSCFLSREFYFVYTNKSKSEGLLKISQNKIKEAGGAGVIIQSGDYFYVTSSVYFNKADAENVKSRLESAGFDAEILVVYSSQIAKKYQNLLKQNQSYFELFKQIYDLPEILEKKCYDFLSGKINEAEFISILTKIKIEIQSKQKLCEQELIDDLQPLLYINNIIINNIDNLFNKFVISVRKESLCYECYTSAAKNFIELCSNFK